MGLRGVTRTMAAGLIGVLATVTTAAEEKPIWEALGLASTDVAGRKVYFEKSLEGKLGQQLDAYAKFQAGRAKRDELVKRIPDAVAEVERMLGPAVLDKAAASMREQFEKLMAGTQWFYGVPVCFVTRPTLMAHMEAGHAVPLYQLDRERKKLNFSFEFDSKAGPPPAVPALVLGVGEDGSVLGGLPVFRVIDGRRLFWVMLHEAAEGGAVSRMKLRGPYWRWVSDGLGNTVAERVAAKFMGREDAAAFSGVEDPAKYEDVRQAVNLPYWMAVATAIEPPTPAERRLSNARYTFATVEVRHLIDTHGEQVIPKLIDAISKTGGADRPAAVVEAVKAATGEDVLPRMKRYMQTPTPAEEIKLQQKLGGEAAKNKDFPAMLSHVLRTREVDPASPDVHTVLPELLVRAGCGPYLHTAYRKEMALLADPKVAALRGLTQKRFVAVAVEYGQAGLFADAAEEVLKADPSYLPALAARMVKLNQTGQTEAAKDLAKQIEPVAAEKSAAYRLAREVLGKPAGGGK